MDIEFYFNDTPVEVITNGEYTTISVYRGVIYFANIIDNKIVRGVTIGRVMYLSGAEHFKSQAYNEYTDIIFEEFLTKNGYLSNEPSTLQDLVSTVARRRCIRVWLIGNTINRVCPYYTEWNLYNIRKQKQGTIDVYENVTEQIDENGNNVVVKIAVEYCKNSGKNSKMFFGSKEKDITSGAWETGSYNLIHSIKEDYDICHKILLKSNNFSFMLNLCIDTINGGCFIYVYPYTGCKYVERIISDEFSTNPMHTDRFILPQEQIFKDCIKLNRVVFSDDLTGEDFNAILKIKNL